MQSTSGYDIIFTSDAAGQNFLDWEIDSYNPTTGASTFWVRIPELSNTSDTVIYMWYGIPNILTSLENPLGVWSNSYLSVYHFGSGSVLGTLDSAFAGYPLTGSASVGVGIFGSAASFSGDPTSFLYHDGVPLYPTGNSPVTLEVWEQSSTSAGLVGSTGSDLVSYGGLNNLGAVGLIDYGVGFGLNFSGAFDGYYLGSNVDLNWHQMVGVYGGGNVSSATTTVYYDGQSAAEGYASGTPSITTDELTIGQYPEVRGCCTVTGSLDEVRISSVPRSADWIATEFNNQSAPYSFATIRPLTASITTQLGVVLNPTTVSKGYPTIAQITITSSSSTIPAGSVSCTSPGITSPAPAQIDTTTGTIGIMLGSINLAGSFPVGSDLITCSFAPTSPSVLGSGGSATLTVTAATQTGTISGPPVMSSSRVFHTGTLLTDGTVLLAGGSSDGNDPEALKTADIFDPQLNSMSATSTTMFTPRARHTASRLKDGTVLVAGGENYQQGILASAEIYNPAQNARSFSPAVNNMITQRTIHTATVLNDGSVAMIGGLTGGPGQGGYPTTAVERYVPGTGFTNAGNIQTARWGHTATLLSTGKVLVVGGKDSNNLSLSSVEVYDPTTGTSTQATSLTAARAFHTATVLPDGRVLISGGSDSSGNSIQGNELYSVNSQGVITGPVAGPSAQQGRNAASATILSNGNVWIAGGQYNQGNSVYQSSETFRPSPTVGGVDTTVADVNLTHARAFHTATGLADGSVLLSGGYDPNYNVLASTERYAVNAISGSMNMKYLVLSLVYAPPGSKSNVNYGANSQIGSNNTLSSTFSNMVGYTTSLTADAILFGVQGSGTVSQGYAYTQQSSSSHSVTINKTNSIALTVAGPTSDAAGIDHDYDQFAIWLDPMVNLSFFTPTSLSWNGFSAQLPDPFSSIGLLDVVYLTVAELKNPQTIPQSTLDVLARSWDVSGVGGLNSTDFANILALDPFVANPNYDPSQPDPVSGTYRYVVDTSGPPWQYATGLTQNQMQTSTTTTTDMTGGMDTYQLTFSVDFASAAGFDALVLGAQGKLDVKATNTTTWTDTSTRSMTTGSGSTAAVTIVGPAPSVGWNGPQQLVVWQDTTYNSFLFTFAPYASTLTVLPQATTITIGSSLSLSLTAGSSVYGQANGKVTCSGPGANPATTTVTNGVATLTLTGLSAGAPDLISCHFSGYYPGLVAGFTDSMATTLVTVQ